MVINGNTGLLSLHNTSTPINSCKILITKITQYTVAHEHFHTDKFNKNIVVKWVESTYFITINKLFVYFRICIHKIIYFV